MRRYRQNILQWEENKTECTKRPTGDYFMSNGTQSVYEDFVLLRNEYK